VLGVHIIGPDAGTLIAEAALAKWAFNPAAQVGAPVETRWNVAIGFTSDGNLDLKWRLAPRPCIGGLVVGHVPAAAPAPVAPPAAPAPAVPAEKK